MKTIRTAALAATCLLAATTMALAAKTYTVDTVSITGSRTVPESTLRGAIKSRPGVHVTQQDVEADQMAIHDLLASAHVVGGVKTSMALKGSHMAITFIVDDQGAQTATVTKVAPKLSSQVFAGNKKIPSADLEAATGLKPGDELTDARVRQAQAAIGDLYQKRKAVNASIQGGIKTDSAGRVEIDWTITETKLKEKPAEPQDNSGYGGTGQ